MTKMRKIKPGKHTVHSEMYVTALPVWGHKGAVVRPWTFADIAMLSSWGLSHGLLFSLESLFSSSFFPSLNFLSLMLWLFSPVVWLQIHGHFLPAPARDCWAGTMHIPKVRFLGLQYRLLRFSTAYLKGQQLHHLLLFGLFLCLLLPKVSKVKLKTLGSIDVAITRCW